MAAAGIGGANFRGVGIKGIMGRIIGTTGYRTDKTPPFRVPAVMPVFCKLQGPAVKADVTGLGRDFTNDTPLRMNSA